MERMAKFLDLDGKSNYYKRENGMTNFKSTELPVLCDVLDLNYEKKASSELERIGDHAVGIAKETIRIK
ncbi:phosphate transport system regulatory protein PhoU, partial [Pediococcus acidilactici]